MSEYNEIDNFDTILQLAKEIIDTSDSPYFINFNLKVSFGIELTKDTQLPNVSEDANDWQSIKKPENLHFSHGEFIGEEGYNHLVTELKNKRDSNRAILSLISQEHIINSGDKPIPSFMIFQCGLEGDELYVTTYFRALEINKFLPINLEEFRLIIAHINREIVDIKKINLNIIAFRAYNNSEQSTLKRFKIDIMKQHKLLLYMQSDPNRILSMLKEKMEESTVGENSGFINLLDIIEDEEMNRSIVDCFKQPLIRSSLLNCISKSNQLSEQRSRTSHNQSIRELNSQIKESLQIIIQELEDTIN